DEVMITTGTSEANFLALASLVASGDEVVVVMPNYMQVHGIATALGARVREVWLREERAWTIDFDALAAAVNSRTKVICVCQPNTRPARSSRRLRCRASCGSRIARARGSSRTRSTAGPNAQRRRARRSAGVA